MTDFSCYDATVTPPPTPPPTPTPTPTVSTGVTKEVQDAQLTTQTVVLTSVGVGSVMTLLSSSSSNSAFASLNQFQLYLLMPMVGTTVHQNLMDYLQGFDFTLFSFKFIDLSKISLFEKIPEFFDFQNDNVYLSSIGMESHSAIINVLGTVSLVVCIFCIHLMVFLPIYY